ncbi:pilus assembly protein CpaB [Vibrio sp. JC009]|uniref:pilus assembly protein CpaB n=1 Tax=Vibrio sp. JC009 TaxID=2912314 RepID=UPI0023B1802E|nr:pilus assembly protein CpaB [Vibrio sp. JC009]WED24565.1 pilus assembly protein CpaB [Vibrio sp. JC009]
MSRPILFLFIAAITLTATFYLKDALFSNSEVVVEEQAEEQIRIALLTQSVSRGQVARPEHVSYKTIPVSTAKQKGYPLEKSPALTPVTRYRRDLSTGDALIAEFIANPDDDEYALLALKKGHIPYFYKTQSNSFIDSLPLRSGDKVSFLSTTSSQSNILETGYSDIADITAQIIINDTDVLQVIRPDEDAIELALEQGEKPEYSVVVALSIEETLLLEMAQKVGDVTMVPAKLAQTYQSVRSSDLIEGQHGVRELRAEVKK